MKKILFAYVALVALFVGSLSLARPALAGPYDSPTITKSITIDKRIGVPHDAKGTVSYEFIDNVSTDKHTFGPSDVVFFELRVKNTSNVALTGVVVKDFAPEYFELFENPGVYVDTNKKSIKLEAGDFAAGEEKVFQVRGRIYHENILPAGTFCVTNRARAESDNVSDEDSAQFCFNKTVPPTTTTVTKTVTKGGTTQAVETIPSTGPADGLMIIGLSTALGYLGMRLRKAA